MPTQAEKDTAEADGYNDYWSRYSLNDNPYRDDDYQLYLAWNRGWYKAKREDEQERND